jgi:hypothetical protein
MKKPLTKKDLKPTKTFKVAGETYQYARENKKIGNFWSQRWLMIYENGATKEFEASSDKIAFLVAMTLIIKE